MHGLALPAGKAEGLCLTFATWIGQSKRADLREVADALHRSMSGGGMLFAAGDQGITQGFSSN